MLFHLFRKYSDKKYIIIADYDKEISDLEKNVPICEKFVGSMVYMGLDVCFLHTSSAVHGDMGLVKEGDLVILLTKSGETSESIYFTRLLKKRRINLWLLIFMQESTLTKEIPNCSVMDLIMGDLIKENIRDVWYGKKFKRARESMQKRRENYGTCRFYDTLLLY